MENHFCIYLSSANECFHTPFDQRMLALAIILIFVVVIVLSDPSIRSLYSFAKYWYIP